MSYIRLRLLAPIPKTDEYIEISLPPYYYDSLETLFPLASRLDLGAKIVRLDSFRTRLFVIDNILERLIAYAIYRLNRSGNIANYPNYSIYRYATPGDVNTTSPYFPTPTSIDSYYATRFTALKEAFISFTGGLTERFNEPFPDRIYDEIEFTINPRNSAIKDLVIFYTRLFCADTVHPDLFEEIGAFRDEASPPIFSEIDEGEIVEASEVAYFSETEFGGLDYNSDN